MLSIGKVVEHSELSNIANGKTNLEKYVAITTTLNIYLIYGPGIPPLSKNSKKMCKYALVYTHRNTMQKLEKLKCSSTEGLKK